jgi:hypothetical protein
VTVGFARRSLFPRRHATPVFSTIEALVEALRKQLATADAGSTSADALRGQIAGAEAPARATLPYDPTLGSRRYAAGVLAGSLHAHLIRTMGKLSSDVMLPTAAYAASLVTGPTTRSAAEATPTLLQVHLYASLRADARGDLPADVELEAFRWLASLLSVPVSPELVAGFETSRRRRLDLRAARASEQAMDPATAAAARVERRLGTELETLERQLAAAEPGSVQADRLRGAIAGVTTASQSDRLTTAADNGTSEAYREGQLGGHLLASLLRDDRNPGNRLRAICYRYAAALASSQARPLLAGDPPANVLKAHALGIHVVDRGSGAPIEEDLELALLGWLAAQLDVPLTPEVVNGRKRFVVRLKPSPG